MLSHLVYAKVLIRGSRQHKVNENLHSFVGVGSRQLLDYSQKLRYLERLNG